MSITRHLAPLLMLSVLQYAAHGQRPPTDYSHRDGAAEARAALASGRPVQIYTYEYSGRLTAHIAPGIVDCSAPGGPGQIEPRVFVSLPEADVGAKDAHDRFAVAAILYAGRFNRVMIVQRAAELQKRCPTASLDPNWPENERKLVAELARLQAERRNGR